MLSDEEIEERIAERLGQAPHHQESRQQNLPVDTARSLSSSTCALSGDPPFTVHIRQTCRTEKPIWALISLMTPWSHGVQILDPTRRYRRIGPSSDWWQEDWSEDERDYEDSELVRLAPGKVHGLFFTFSAIERASGLRASDMRTLTAGNTYHINLGGRQWRWMFEDDMPAEVTAEERKATLFKLKPMRWKPDCVVTFKAIL